MMVVETGATWCPRLSPTVMSRSLLKYYVCDTQSFVWVWLLTWPSGCALMLDHARGIAQPGYKHKRTVFLYLIPSIHNVTKMSCSQCFQIWPKINLHTGNNWYKLQNFYDWFFMIVKISQNAVIFFFKKLQFRPTLISVILNDCVTCPRHWTWLLCAVWVLGRINKLHSVSKSRSSHIYLVTYIDVRITHLSERFHSFKLHTHNTLSLLSFKYFIHYILVTHNKETVRGGR